MSLHGPAVKVAAQLIQETSLPPSVNGSPWLYMSALTSMMSVACLGLGIFGWMVRDSWRDRYLIHPKTLLFNFRMMMAICGFAAFNRAMPEVLYLQMYGDPQVTAHTQAIIMMTKRFADSIAIWLVMGWMGILVVIYPPLCVALKSGSAKYVVIDRAAAWPRLVRPAICFVCICIVSTAFAYAKVYHN